MTETRRGRIVAMAPALSRTPAPGGPLTGRQVDVLDLLAAGLTSCEIGRELHVTEQTVKTLIVRILRKLAVPNRAAAVHRGWELGYLGPSRPMSRAVS